MSARPTWRWSTEQVPEQPDPCPATAFMSHGRERCSATRGVIDTACACTLIGTRWCKDFEMDEEVPLLISMGVVKLLGSVI